MFNFVNLNFKMPQAPSACVLPAHGRPLRSRRRRLRGGGIASGGQPVSVGGLSVGERSLHVAELSLSAHSVCSCVVKWDNLSVLHVSAHLPICSALVH